MFIIARTTGVQTVVMNGDGNTRVTLIMALYVFLYFVHSLISPKYKNVVFMLVLEI